MSKELPYEITIPELIALQRKYKATVLDILTKYCEVHIVKGEANGILS